MENIIIKVVGERTAWVGDGMGGGGGATDVGGKSVN